MPGSDWVHPFGDGRVRGLTSAPMATLRRGYRSGTWHDHDPGVVLTSRSHDPAGAHVAPSTDRETSPTPGRARAVDSAAVRRPASTLRYSAAAGRSPDSRSVCPRPRRQCGPHRFARRRSIAHASRDRCSVGVPSWRLARHTPRRALLAPSAPCSPIGRDSTGLSSPSDLRVGRFRGSSALDSTASGEPVRAVRKSYSAIQNLGLGRSLRNAGSRRRGLRAPDRRPQSRARRARIRRRCRRPRRHDPDRPGRFRSLVGHR